MLILVGVTINFAINGGIINKAKEAGKQTQIAADREALLSCVIASMGLDGKVNFTELDQEILKIEFTGSNGTYTSKAGNTFTVDENGVITNEGERQAVDPDLAYLKSYFVGKGMADVIEDMSGPVFNDHNITMDMDSMEEMGSPEPGQELWYPIKYKGKLYNIYFIFNESMQSELDIVFSDVKPRQATTPTETTGNTYVWTISDVFTDQNNNYIDVNNYYYKLNDTYMLICSFEGAAGWMLYDINDTSELTLSFNNDESIMYLNSGNDTVECPNNGETFTYNPQFDQENGFYTNAVYYCSNKDSYLNTFGDTHFWFHYNSQMNLDYLIYYTDIHTNENEGKYETSQNGKTITIYENSSDVNPAGDYVLLEADYFD